MKKHNFVHNILCPLTVAAIWGAAFSAQSIGADHVEPNTFNAARAVIAVAALFIVYIISRLIQRKPVFNRKNDDTFKPKKLITGGIVCGTALTLSTLLQQTGLESVDAGKAGFISALYLVLVPLASVIFLKKKMSPTVLISAAIAVVGLYLLCIKKGSFSVESGDIYIILCAAGFTVHILSIDHFVQDLNGLELSLTQFIVMTIESTVLALIFEHPNMAGIMSCIGAVLYLGVMSSGVAYTLQMIAQKGSDPAVVALLMSLESVFSVITGTILGERMTGREYVGCIVMLVAVVLSQLPHDKLLFWKKKKSA